MGYIRYRAILITTVEDHVNEIRQQVEQLGLEILGPSRRTVNHEHTLVVCPDGGKVGGSNSDDAELRRRALLRWLRDYVDAGTVHWTHVAYGADVTGSIADILDSDSYHDDTSERQKQIPEAIKKLTRGEARALGVETLWVRYHPASADSNFNLD